MAQYLILIYEDESPTRPRPPGCSTGPWRRTTGSPSRSPSGGKLIGGEALQPTSTATTIRGDVVTDGPFVETKEVLGGYYLIEAPDLDHAIAIGKLCPAPFGGVEVRPIMVFRR